MLILFFNLRANFLNEDDSEDETLTEKSKKVNLKNSKSSEIKSTIKKKIGGKQPILDDNETEESD